MRMPRLRDLTELQKNVYLYAPSDAHVLVEGPPGTGKTLIACLRAVEYQKRKEPVVLGMFNSVLAKYSANADGSQQMPARTVNSWFHEWWYRSGLPPHGASDAPLILQVPFRQNAAVKAAGAEFQGDVWRPWGGGRGAWTVTRDVLEKTPGAFAEWRVWHEPPRRADNAAAVDWAATALHVLLHLDTVTDEALNLGAVLIDEGQDFPPGFYELLWNLHVVAQSRGHAVSHPPRYFILADENQQLTGENSTLAEIESALRIKPAHRYRLLDNFRNTREIALVARSFFSDVGVLPNLPHREGAKPVFSCLRSRSDVVPAVKTWLTNNPGREVGVLVFTELTRGRMFEALQAELGPMGRRTIRVQTYSYAARKDHPAKALAFDEPDVVTVLNMQSCKGLEFDAVFIVDPHEAQIGLYGPDRFRMQMFVGVSRAREWVCIADSGPSAGTGAFMQYLPGEEFLARAAAPGPRRVSAREPAQPQPPAGKEKNDGSWESAAARVVKRLKLRSEDNRDRQGAYWIHGGPELAQDLEPLGFAYTGRRQAWWRK